MSAKPINEEQSQLNVNKISGYFELDRARLVTLFDHNGRLDSFDEDIKDIQELGGTEGILKKVRTTFETGLSDKDKNDLNQRIQTFGENKFFVEPMPHCCVYVWEGLDDLFMRILMLAAAFQITVGSIPIFKEGPYDYIEGISILIAVVVVVSVGSITNYSKELKFRELNDRNNALVQYTVKRDGNIRVIQEDDILVGEMIKVDGGMILPADGYLIEGSEIKVDEASLTGESDLIEKSTLLNCDNRRTEELEANPGKELTAKHLIPSPLVFSGTQVAEGTGWFVALRIGPDSEKGKIRSQVEAEQQKKKSKSSGKGDNKDKPQGEGGQKLMEDDKKEESNDDNDDENKTPLELKLDVLAADVGAFGLASALLTFVALAIRLIITSVQSRENANTAILNQNSNWFNTTILNEPRRKRESFDGIVVLVDIIKIVILCIAIVVVAIPEGLPLAVTLSLSFSIGKMMDDNNLVRKMNACETMGGANFICSDKTGTLTKNEMSIDCYYDCLDVKSFKVLTADKSKREEASNYLNPKYYEMFRYGLLLNIDVEVDSEENIVKGSKTDYSFVYLLHNFGEKIKDVQDEFFLQEKGDMKRFPFTSSRKKMSTILSNPKFNTEHIIFMKGASEIVLASCRKYLDPNTNEQCVISDEKILVFRSIIKEFADQALRTICIAFKDLNQEQVTSYKEKDENKLNLIEKDGFTLIGIFGIKDQLREGVATAVDKCQGAGIQVVMVTGDNVDTANAIARECHIINDEIEEDAKKNNKVISYVGKDFYDKIGGMKCDSCELDLKFCTCPRTEGQAEAFKKKKQELDPNFDEEVPLRKERIVDMEKFKEICHDIRVIARSRPEDKYTMVYGLRELGDVVAVTGDGTNDAPALSKSDVGFAMGISGTDIAKQAADIIILDDNFATIVQAVKWGRNIYDNIRKFIQFQLTVNICACLLVFIASCIGKETPLSAIQMLWVNLIMDSLGSLALATEPPNDNLLNRKPYAKTEYIISNLMWKHIFWQSMVELAIMLFLYLYAHKFVPETNPDMIKIATKLRDCYGVIPGQEGEKIQDINKMIAGPTIFWPLSIERLPDTLPDSCGLFFNYKNLHEAHKVFIATYGSTHLTVIFNTFVLYTLFNEFNARSIDDSYNICLDIHKNLLFIIILLIELGLQALIVSVGGLFAIFFKVSTSGLDGPQWGICFAFGASTFLVSILLKPIPCQNCFAAIFTWWQKYKEKKEQEKQAKEAKEVKEVDAGSDDKSVKVENAKNKETNANANIQLKGDEIKISSKESSVKNLNKVHNESKSMEKKEPSNNILKIRRPSRQLTNKMESKMRSIKPEN